MTDKVSISEYVSLFGDRVLIEPTFKEDDRTSRIVLPESAKEKVLTGKVLAVGPGARDNSGNLIPMEVQVNDYVMCANEWAGSKIELNGKKYTIIKQSDILLKFSDNKF